MAKININKRIGLVLIGFVVVVGVVVAWQKFDGSAKKSEIKDGYVAVYMSSGDIYFGKLQRSYDKLNLSNAYTLQRTDDKKTPFTLVKFGAAFWGPKGDIELSRENVLWVAELSDNSPVLKSIRDQEAASK